MRHTSRAWIINACCVAGTHFAHNANPLSPCVRQACCMSRLCTSVRALRMTMLTHSARVRVQCVSTVSKQTGANSGTLGTPSRGTHWPGVNPALATTCPMRHVVSTQDADLCLQMFTTSGSVSHEVRHPGPRRSLLRSMGTAPTATFRDVMSNAPSVDGDAGIPDASSTLLRAATHDASSSFAETQLL